MTEDLKHLLKHRLQAAVLAFSKAHKIPLKGEVVKLEEWVGGQTLDLWMRIDVEGGPQEGTVI